MRARWGIGFLLGTLVATPVFGVDAAQKCQAGKLKVAGKYSFCRLKAQAKAVQTGGSPDYSKCDATLSDKWPGLESKAGGECPTNGDLGTQAAELAENARLTAWEISGIPRFVDNGDGTITDNQTGLQWERKIQRDGVYNFANPFDADNIYPWAGACSLNIGKVCQPTAAAAGLCAANVEHDNTGCGQCISGEGTCSAPTTGWTLAVDRNSANFGGHNDWRVPTRNEVFSIIDYADTTMNPMTYLAFDGASCGATCADVTSPDCSCAGPVWTWSASTLAPTPNLAWIVSFGDGSSSSGIKAYYNAGIRLVRGGS